MKYKCLSKREVFRNTIISVYEEELLLPNDEKVVWTFTGRKDVVAIIANIENSILFVKQYRPALGKELLEIPAGVVENNETIVEAAKREFEEETGYRARNIEKICSYYNSAGLNSSKYHIFYASDLEKTKQRLDRHEFLEVVKIPFEKIDIFSLEDSKTIIALNFFKEKILKKI